MGFLPDLKGIGYKINNQGARGLCGCVPDFLGVPVLLLVF